MRASFFLASLPIIAAVVGILQWLFMRRQVTHSVLWIPASSLGWAVAHSEWMWDLDFGLAPGIATVVVRRALLGPAFGAFTGICLILLLKDKGGQAVS